MENKVLLEITRLSHAFKDAQQVLMEMLILSIDSVYLPVLEVPLLMTIVPCALMFVQLALQLSAIQVIGHAWKHVQHSCGLNLKVDSVNLLVPLITDLP